MPFISAYADHSPCHWSCTAVFKSLLIIVHVRKCTGSRLSVKMMCAYGRIFFIGVVMEALSSLQGGLIITCFILFAHCPHAYYKNQGFPRNSFMWGFKMGSSICSTWLKNGFIALWFSVSFFKCIFNGYLQFPFLCADSYFSKIWATFTLVKALKSISEGFVAISLNLEAILVSFSLITCVCNIYLLLMRLPTIIQATKYVLLVMLFYFSPCMLLFKVECLLCWERNLS